MGGKSSDVISLKLDLSTVRLILARDDTQKCCLASPVWAHETHGLARMNIKTQLPKSNYPAKMLTDPND